MITLLLKAFNALEIKQDMDVSPSSQFGPLAWANSMELEFAAAQTVSLSLMQPDRQK